MAGNLFNEQRLCVECKSVHPDDFLKRIEDGRIQLVPDDGPDKVWIFTIGGGRVRLFRWIHFSESQQATFIELFKQGRVRFGERTPRFTVMPYFMQHMRP